MTSIEALSSGSRFTAPPFQNTCIASHHITKQIWHQNRLRQESSGNEAFFALHLNVDVTSFTKCKCFAAKPPIGCFVQSQKPIMLSSGSRSRQACLISCTVRVSFFLYLPSPDLLVYWVKVYLSCKLTPHYWDCLLLSFCGLVVEKYPIPQSSLCLAHQTEQLRH